jgi:hypothetical protein
MLARRAALLAAVRDAFPEFVGARLAQRDDGTWLDVWRWDAPASAPEPVSKPAPRAAEEPDGTGVRARPLTGPVDVASA